MNKPSFSFVKWLTKRDVEKILEQNGYEINYDLPTPYSKFKSDDGYYYIVVKCTKTKLTATEEVLDKIYTQIFNKYASIYGLGNSNTILEFSDFMLIEFIASLDNEEAIKTNKQLTNNYQKYMAEKFGKFYVNMKKAYIRKLYKDDKIKEETEKEEN